MIHFVWRYLITEELLLLLRRSEAIFYAAVIVSLGNHVMLIKNDVEVTRVLSVYRG